MTDNKYSGIGRRLLDERAAREASAIDLTGKESPDVVAEQFRLAEQAGAPVEAVRDDPEGARLKLERDRLASLSPATRRWLAANPDNYAIAKDDTGPLNEMAVRFGAGLMRNMPIFGGLAGIEAPRPAMQQMHAPQATLAQEITGMLRAGWYSGQAGGAIGLPDFSSARSRQVADTVARGFGLAGADQAEGIAVGAYVADRSAAADAAGVTSAETQAQFQKIAEADKAGTWSAAAGAWATSPRAIMATLSQSLGATAPGIALTAAMPASRAVRMATAGGTSFTAEQGFTVLDEMEKAGVDTTDAAAVAAFVNDPAKMAEARERALSRGLAIGAFDALSAGFAGRLIANARRGMASAAAATAGEAAVQTAAGMAGEATAQIATDGKITSRAEVVGEGLAQAPMFLVEARGMMRDARRAGEANAERHQAEAEHSAIGDLVRIAGQSKTRERARGKFEGMVRELAADGQDAVHLSPEAVQVLYQSAQEQGVDLAGLVDEGELSAAIASGAELAIPIERYASMVNEAMHSAVASVGGARLTPGMVAGPPDVAREDVRAAIEQALAEIDAKPQARDNGEAGQVYDEVYGQLLSRMDEASAERNASVVQAVYRNLAERMGISPMALFQQFKINIPGAVTDRRAAPRGIDLDIDPFLDALRAGRLPDDNEVLGPSLTRALRAAGGLVDFGGELASMDAGRVLPGLVSGSGMTLDDALTWAYQEGYITEAPVQFAEQYSDGAPDINTLLELIGEDLRSGSVRSVSRLNEDRQGFRDRAMQLADELEARGIDLQAMTNEQVRQALYGGVMVNPFDLDSAIDALVDEKNAINDANGGIIVADELLNVLMAASAPTIDYEQLIQAIKSAIEIGRKDIAKVVVERLRSSAKSRRSAKPGTSKDSPKYESILSDLSRLADEADSFLKEAEKIFNDAYGEESTTLNVLEQAAYHGTPHTVDRFSLQKIGTGEGNQVYGWGLYFASQREVAEHYRTALTGINRMPGAKSAEEMLAKTGGDRAEAIRLLKRKGDEAAVEFLRRNQSRGNLYQVEVPENDVLLDWDAPISEQPEAVRAAIERINDIDPIKNRSGQEILAYDPTGQEVYIALGGGESASIALRDAGIPGLRYLDGVSRGGSEGSHNYVIWDEALISEPVKLNQSDVLEQSVSGDFSDPVRVVNVDPAALLFRESEQNRVDSVREMFPDGDFPPVVVADTPEGLLILDGHNRAAVAKEDGLGLRAVIIQDGAYRAAKREGHDEVDIAHAALEVAGESEAASMLRQQFPGSSLIQSEADISEIIESQSDPVRLNQSDVPAGDELVTVHNLSADNLLFADQLGGLPVPSIGITKAATAFDGFGEISLVGTSALADPSNGPVFSGDAYTQRFPEVLWPAVKAKAADKFLSSFGETYQESDTDMVHDHLVNDPNRDKAIYEGTKSATFMRAWLKEQGETPVPPVMQNAAPGFGVEWLQVPEYVAAVRAEIDSEAAFEPSQADEVKARLSAAARKAADAWIEEGARQVEASGRDPARSRAARSKVVERHLREDGLTTSAIDQSVDYALRLKQAEGRPARVDQYGTRRALREQIGDERTADFEAWVAEKVGGLFAEPQIKVGRKKVPMTLENIVEAMTSEKVKNTEKTMTFGGGQIAAAASKQFKTLAEVRADRARVASPQEHRDAKKSVDGLLDSFRTGVVGHYTHTNYSGEIDTWSAMDDAGKALAAAAKKKPTEKSIRAALTRVGFKGNEVPADVIDAGMQALSSMQSMVTDYFEAKPQRAVLLSEFAGAVIPSDASPEVRAALERAGLKIAEYDPSNDSGRSEGIRALSAELHAERGDVLFQGGDTPRGSVTLRGQAGARVFDIELTAKMDASTFMHEMGHVYLEMLGDLAQRPDAPQQIRDDLATINRWLGRAEGEPLTVDQHEQFARGFEAYLREGKAPSSAMRKAFAAFKVWLTAIYRSARQLNVELSDEVRGVFDRLIATDAEIDDVRDAQGLTPLVADGLAIGMTPAEAAAYAEAQALAQADAEQVIAGEVLRAMRREQQAWYRAEKAKVREQVREELRNDPVYRAMRLMRRGQMPDGSPAPAELVVKLSKDDLLDQFGQSFLRNLSGMYSVEGGVSADQAAALYGFGSGREMIDALVNAPKFEAAVAATTDARMADRYPDPMTDGTLPDRAMFAAHRDRQRDMMLLEVQALERSVNGRSRTTAQVIKGVARAMVGRTKLRSLQPASYRAAEAKAGRDAFKALAAGDNAAVLEARKRQLLNHELYREAVKQRDRAAKIAKYLGKFNKNKERAKLGKVGGPYLDQVDGLLERFDFRAVSNARADKRAALREWVEAQHKSGKTVNIAPKLLDDAYRVPYREMTSDDLAALHDAIKQIEALATLKGKLILAGKLRDAAEVDAAMAASVIDGHDARPVTTGERPRMEKVRDAFLQGRVLQGTATDIAHELDGWKDGGAVWENTVGVMRDAVYNNLNPALQKAQDDLATIYTKHYTPDELRAFADTFPVAEAGGDLWSKRRVLALALNWGNEGNRAAILAQKRPRLTQATVNALLARLDSRDWAFVQDVWNHVNSFWPQIAEVTKRRAGLVPEKVEASGFTITTSDGKVMHVDGGYFPLKYEADSLKAMGEQIDDYYEDLKAGRFASAHVRNGSTIERVGSGGRTVSLELSNIGSHVSDVLRDIHLGDAVNYVGQVLDGPAFKESIERVGLMQYHKALQVWLKDAATGEIAPRTYSEQVARAVRQNFTASVLTWKATTAMLQVSGIIPAGVLLGNGNVLAALRVWMASPRKMTAYARELSPFLDARLRTHIEAVQTVMDAEAGRIAAGRAAMIRFGYWAIGRIQGIVDTVTWLAAEQVGARKFNGDMDKARAFADDAVTRAQGSGEFIDKSMLQRGTFGDNVRQSEWVKATTALQGYMIAKGNLVYSRTSNTRFKDPAQASRWAMDMLMLFTVEGLITAMIQGKLPDDEEDDGAADDWSAFLAGDFASAVVGVIPGGGTVVSAAKGFDTGGVVAGAWKAYGDLVEQVADGELDKGVRRAAVNVMGVTLGFPSNQVNKTLDAIEADADGKDVSPYEYIAGLTKENKK